MKLSVLWFQTFEKERSEALEGLAKKEMARELVPPVEAAGVGAQKPFHPGDQIRLGRLDHQMKMIRHENVGVNLPVRLGASLGQRLDKALAIRLVFEDRLAPVAATCSRMELAGKPRHRSQNPRGEGEIAGSDRIKAFGVHDACRAEAHSASGW